jgi:hypothetical protein
MSRQPRSCTIGCWPRAPPGWFSRRPA